MTVATHLFNAKGKAVSSLKHLPLNSLTWHMLFEPVQIQKSYYLQNGLKKSGILESDPLVIFLNTMNHL